MCIRDSIDMASLKNPVFGNHVKAKSESPFSAFATNINKPSSTTPAFSFGNSTINKSNTFTAAHSSERVSFSPTEETGNKEASEPGPMTLKDEENPFLPRKEEISGRSPEKDHNQEAKDAVHISGNEKPVNTPEQVCGNTKQEQIPAAQDVYFHERSETNSKYGQHVMDDHDLSLIHI